MAEKAFDKKMVGYGAAISINTFDDGLVAGTTNIQQVGPKELMFLNMLNLEMSFNEQFRVFS